MFAEDEPYWLPVGVGEAGHILNYQSEDDRLASSEDEEQDQSHARGTAM